MKFTTRGLKLPFIALVGVIFAAISVLGRPSAAPTEPHTPPPSAGTAHTVAGIGVVEPKSELISIGVELPGVVREVAVAVGDAVKKGDLLFVLDQREVDAQVTTLEATLAAARVQAEDAAAQFAIVESVADKRAIAKDDYNRRKFARELAVARVKEIEAQLAQVRTTKNRQTVRAPIDGQVLEINVRPGEFASAGALASPLMRMGDVSTLHVRVEIDEENATRVKPELGANAFRRGDTKDALALRFVRFEPYVRPKQNLAVAGQRVDTRVLQVIYALPEGAQGVFVGQQMDVFIEEQP